MLLKISYLVFIIVYHAKRGLLCALDIVGRLIQLAHTRYLAWGILT
jgi:hypothetical protein